MNDRIHEQVSMLYCTIWKLPGKKRLSRAIDIVSVIKRTGCIWAWYQHSGGREAGKCQS